MGKASCTIPIHALLVMETGTAKAKVQGSSSCGFDVETWRSTSWQYEVRSQVVFGSSLTNRYRIKVRFKVEDGQESAMS